VSAVDKLVCPLGTDLNAVAAANALLRGEDQLGLSGYPLGVVAPNTAERAAFEENSGADSGAVMDGETLDVKDRAPDSLVSPHRFPLIAVKMPPFLF